jgi:hypothetical protein
MCNISQLQGDERPNAVRPRVLSRARVSGISRSGQPLLVVVWVKRYLSSATNHRYPRESPALVLLETRSSISYTRMPSHRLKRQPIILTARLSNRAAHNQRYATNPTTLSPLLSSWGRLHVFAPRLSAYLVQHPSPRLSSSMNP